jgi:hypothetical protein
MASYHLLGDRLDDIAEGKFPCLLGHLRMIDDLQKQVAELIAQVIHIAARDCVGDLVGLLDRVRGDRREILLDVPWTPGVRIAQGGHDLYEAGDIAGGLHPGNQSASGWAAAFYHAWTAECRLVRKQKS